MPLNPGTHLGHYDVTALLGEGGLGQVWQATDTQLSRLVDDDASWLSVRIRGVNLIHLPPGLRTVLLATLLGVSPAQCQRHIYRRGVAHKS